MKNSIKTSSLDERNRRFRSKIESEEIALVLSLREAEMRLKRLNRDGAASEDETGSLDDREAWAIKTNYYRNRLRLVRESLSRLRSGNFGVCAACNEDIGEKRLDAVPTAIYCLECQEEAERGGTRLYDLSVRALYPAALSL